MRAATYNEVFAFLWRSIISISSFFDCFGVHRSRQHHQLPRDNNGEIVQGSNVASLFTTEDKKECTGEEHESLVHHVDRTDIEEELLEHGKIAQERSVTSLIKTDGAADVADKEECTVEEQESLIYHVDRSDIEEKLLEEEEIVQETSVSSLITTEDKEESTVTQYENLIHEVDQSHIDDELLEQAKFLKACGTLPETPAEIRKLVTLAEKVEKLDVKESQSVLKSSAEISDEIQQAYAANLHEHVEISGFGVLPNVLEFSPETSEETQVTDTSSEDSAKLDTQRLHGELRFSLHSGTLPETPAEIRRVVSFAEKVKMSDIKESESVLKSAAETSDKIQQAQALNHHENVERSDFCILPSVLEFSPETSEETQVTDTSSEDSDKSDAQRLHVELRSSPRSDTLPEIPAEIRKVVLFAEEVELDIKESQSVLESFVETPDEIQQAQADNLPENVEKSDFCILLSVPESSPEASEETLVTETYEDSDAQRPCTVLRSSPGTGTLPGTPAEIRKVVFIVEKVEKLEVKESQSVFKSSAETPDEIQQSQAENLPENVERTDFCIHPSMLESSPETSEETQVTEPFSEDSAKSDAQRPCSVLRSLPRSSTLLETPAEIRKVVSFAEKVEKLDITESQSELMSLSETPDEIQQAQEGSDLCVLPIVLESSPETSEATQVAETCSEDSAKSVARRPGSVLRSSPYPTPRRITDDMQTPGTVYATNMRNLAQGNLQIRSQYVYTVLNPIENLDHQHELKAEKSPEHESPDHEGAYLSEQESITPCSRMNSTSVADSSGKENIGSVSLASWLKPPLSNNAATHHNLRRTAGDKPIIGLGTTDWNEQEETSHSLPKSWDVNGIPNSTSKYKEDQKVRWHATPFEERLERALSETSSASLRKPIDGMPIVFEETEDEQRDTWAPVVSVLH